MAIKYTNLPENWPKGLKIYQHILLQNRWFFTQSGVFGQKIYHLATLDRLLQKTEQNV
jgi:hypothetical protein